MTIIQLEYLLAVANCGSFSAAAKRCFVTQPSLSMQIKNLEEELGAVLLDRTKKPVMPTVVGEAVLRQAREALSAFNTVKEIVGEARGEMTGTLRLGVLPTIAPYILHLLLPMFEERLPKVEVSIAEMTATQIVEALDRDVIDAAILSGGTTPENVRVEELFSDRFYIYLSPRSLLYGRNTIRLEELSAKDMLMLNEGHCLREQVIDLFATPSGQLPNFYAHYRAGSLDTLMSLVDTTDKMTVLPEMAVRMLSATRRNQVRTLARGAISRKIVLATRRGYIKQSIIATLHEIMVEVGRRIEYGE